MSYENAPQVRLIATHCCCCRRPLVDAASVEYGVGPICRKKYMGDFSHVSEEVRVQANRIVYEISALFADHPIRALEKSDELRALGLCALPDQLEKQLISVHVETCSDKYHVTAPFNANAIVGFRSIGRWNPEKKVWMVPTRNRQALFDTLKQFYGGLLGKGEKGVFEIPRG